LSLLAIGQRKRGLSDDDKRLVSIFDRRDTNVFVMLLFVASGAVLASGTDAGLYLLLPAALVALVSGVLNAWNFLLPRQTGAPALQVLGMRCWRPETGRVAGSGWTLLRETIGRIVENVLSIFTEVLSLILMLSRPDRKTLHDMVAGTVVLYDPDKVLQNRSA